MSLNGRIVIPARPWIRPTCNLQSERFAVFRPCSKFECCFATGGVWERYPATCAIDLPDGTTILIEERTFFIYRITACDRDVRILSLTRVSRGVHFPRTWTGLFPFPFPSLSFPFLASTVPPFFYHSLTSLPFIIPLSPSPVQVPSLIPFLHPTRQIQLGDLGERCKFRQRGPGRSPCRQRICMYFTLGNRR